MRIILDLSEAEIEKLERQLEESDAGPLDGGWRSDLLLSLEGKVLVEGRVRPGRKGKRDGPI